MLESFIAACAVAFAGFGFLLLLIIMVLPLILYCLSSYAYYIMAQNEGIEYPWLSWIPIIKLYILGELIHEKCNISTLKLPYAQIVLPVTAIASTILLPVPFLGGLCFILIMVYQYAALYRLYRLYREDLATVYLVLSIIFPFMISIFPFVFRNHKPLEYYGA